MKINKVIASVTSVLLGVGTLGYDSIQTYKIIGSESSPIENGLCYTVQQVKGLQDFLLNKQVEIEFSSDLDFDVNQDGIWNAIDLCMLKSQVKAVQAEENMIYVSDVDAFRNALENAKAGDTILLNPGTYEASKYAAKGAIFYSNSEGAESAPITVKSADANNPAVLKGTSSSNGIVMYITGDYWNIQNIECSNAQKGIVLDNSNNSIIQNVEVHTIGQEGIHLRDGSSYCVIDSVNVHDTGLEDAIYGEGIYIGSAESTSGYNYNCYYNTVKSCTLGPNITAECVDIKEYTKGNVIENCKLYGSGMTATDSFIDIKGNETIVRNNQCYDQNNDTIVDGFQLHCQVNGWGMNNEVYGNTVTFSSDTKYVLRAWKGTSCTVYDNIRMPANNEYMYHAFSGSTIIEK